MHELPVDENFLDKHGLALTLAVVFAFVIAYLFTLLVKAQKERTKELTEQLQKAQKDREDCEKLRAAERETHSLAEARWEVERGEHDLEISKERQFADQRVLQHTQQQQKDLQELRKEFQAREDDMRRENGEAAERMSAAHTAAMDKVTAILQKFYDRGIGPRSRVR